MEKIQKRIYNETAKSRQAEKMTAYNNGVIEKPETEDYNDWNKIPLNIILEEGELDFPIPKVDYESFMKINGEWTEEDKGKKVLKYTTLCNWKQMLLEFIFSSHYFMLCMRGDERAYVEMTDTKWESFFQEMGIVGDYKDPILRFFSDENRVLVQTIPNTEENYPLGIIICVNGKTDNFKKMFSEEWYNKAYGFYHFFKRAEIGEFSADTRICKSYFDIPLYLEEEYKDNGQFTPYLDFWTPNKKYFIGDRTMFAVNSESGEVYRLKKGDAFIKEEITGSLYEIILKNKDYVTHIPQDLTKTSYYKTGKKIFIFVPYFSGYRNSKNQKTYFDITTDDGKTYDLQHWEICTEQREFEEEVISGVSESQITSYKRLSSSYDDLSNLLPFIVAEENGVGLCETTINYRLGIFNTQYKNGNFYSNIIQDINFYKRDENGELVAVDKDGIVKDGKIYARDELMDIETIEFIYIKDGNIDDGGNYIDGTGIKYIDEFEASLCVFNCLYENAEQREWVEYTGKYDEDEILEGDSEILENTEYYPDGSEVMMGDLVKIIEDNKVFRCEAVFNYINIDYKRKTHDTFVFYSRREAENDEFYNVNIFKNETLNGISDINYSVNGGIDRGKSAAFERHNILGEINTFEDLENYRNNYFNL